MRDATAGETPAGLPRAELIEATGLSGPTVGFLSSHLIARGLTRDLGTAPSRGGRRPVLMEFNARHGFVEVARGFEPTWQLEDVRMHWTCPAAPA